MPLLDLDKITTGLPAIWDGNLRDWDRTLRSLNRPETTRYNYLLAASQLARYLAEYSPDPDADAAATDPTEVTRARIEHFQSWMIETRSATTAINKHKVLKQFFNWLRDDEEDIDHHPMERVKLPKAPKKLIPSCATATPRNCSTTSAGSRSPPYATRPSSASTTAPAPDCPKRPTSTSATSTRKPTRSSITAKARETAASATRNARPGQSPDTYAPEPNTSTPV